jgi:hypothetical protein
LLRALEQQADLERDKTEQKEKPLPSAAAALKRLCARFAGNRKASRQMQKDLTFYTFPGRLIR